MNLVNLGCKALLFDFLFADTNNGLIGYALYYFTYETSVGRNIFLEDFYVNESHRGKGVGNLLWNSVIKVLINVLYLCLILRHSFYLLFAIDVKIIKSRVGH